MCFARDKYIFCADCCARCRIHVHKKNCVLVDKLRLNTVELEKAIPDFIKEPKVSYHSVA